MHYTIHQLEIFLKIVENLSITKASEQLHLTQPAVSIQLKKFQDQFEIPLVEVIGRKLYVTDFGYEVAKSAQKVVEEMQHLSAKTMAYKGLLTGKLRVSSVSTGKYIIPYILSDFIQNNAGVELKLDVTNKSMVLENLANNEVDFSLVSVLPTDMLLETEDLLDNELYPVASPSFVSTKKQYTSAIFEKYPLIFREKGSATRLAMEGYLQGQSIPYSVKLELTSNEAVKQAVIAGLGVSIMPLIGIKNELKNKDLMVLKIPGFPIKTRWQLVWKKGKQLSPVAQSFLAYIRTEKNRVLDEWHYNRINAV